jgi:hypothetical protein
MKDKDQEKSKSEITIVLSGLNNAHDDPDAEAVRDAIDGLLKIMKITKNNLVNKEDVKIVLTKATHSSPATFAFAFQGLEEQEKITEKAFNETKMLFDNPYSIVENHFGQSLFSPFKTIADQTKSKLSNIKLIYKGQEILITNNHATKLEEFSKVFDYSISSFAGILEIVNLHEKEIKFTIYTPSGFAIKCIAEKSKREVISSLVDKFVCVSGKAKYGIGGFIPSELSVQKFEEVKEPKEDVISQLKGSIDDLDGKLPHDYINDLRKNWL